MPYKLTKIKMHHPIQKYSHNLHEKESYNQQQFSNLTQSLHLDRDQLIYNIKCDSFARLCQHELAETFLIENGQLLHHQSENQQYIVT